MHKIAALAAVVITAASAAEAQTTAPSAGGFEMTDEDAAESAAPAPGGYQPYGLPAPQPYSYQPYTYSPYASPGPRPYVPTPPAFTLPAGPLPKLESPSREQPATYGARDYDEAVRAAARAEEMRQGALSGGWTLRSAAGALLYAFELAQSPDQPFAAQGAWRQLGTPARPSIGYLSMAAYDGSQLTLRFNQGPPGELRVVTLRRDLSGRWAGELWRPTGTEAVVLTR
ncbi:MAG TPA: hypothetical protein VF559_05495 [Caulobacteraceae bacterium]|jgi:hypothetical protein